MYSFKGKVLCYRLYYSERNAGGMRHVFNLKNNRLNNRDFIIDQNKHDDDLFSSWSGPRLPRQREEVVGCVWAQTWCLFSMSRPSSMSMGWSSRMEKEHGRKMPSITTWAEGASTQRERQRGNEPDWSPNRDAAEEPRACVDHLSSFVVGENPALTIYNPLNN